MAYIERTVVAGNTVEVKKYHCFKARKAGEPRAKRGRETSLAQEEVNRKKSEDRLRWLLNTNFKGGDYHLVLHYIHREGDEYRKPEEMRADMQVFLRKLRREYKKAGSELKFIYVMEIGKRSSRHVHIVLNEFPIKVVRSCWEHGRISVTPLDDRCDYRELASYLVKQSSETFGNVGALMGKRYSCSRNLQEPLIKKRLITRADTFSEKINEPEGYRVDPDTVEVGCDGWGYRYFKYTVIKLE